jgi:hypothetical protein
LHEASESGEIVPEYQFVALTVGDALYTRQETVPTDPDSDPVRVEKRRALCADLAAAPSNVCNNALAELDVYVEWDQSYRGHAALAVTQSGTSRGSDETYETTTRSYFDPETYLPLGTTQEGTLDVGTIHPVSSDIPVEYNFVRLDTLPHDFFDPVALGYVEEDPMDDLDALEGPVYWLGREFEGGDGFPALVLDDVHGDEMVYRPASGDPPFLAVRINLQGSSPSGPCVETREIVLDDRRATIYASHHDVSLGRDGRCLPADKYSAVVRFDDAFVEVDAPTTNTGSGGVRSAYDSEEGIDLLIRSLKRRD